MENLEEILRRLVSVYGEDDWHREGFNLDDKAQIEEGHWTGRRWFWGNTDSYAFPVHMYMTSPGQVNLVVYGLPASYAQNEPSVLQNQEF